MKDRIQRSMMLGLSIVLVVSYVIIVWIVYTKNLSLLEDEVRQETKYIKTAINISGPEYLENIDNVDRNTRITRIDRDGNVLYDSRQVKKLENHGSRKEVADALKNGEGEDIRLSSTLDKDMYYYALVLEDGKVIRVSKAMYNMKSIALDILPIMSLLFVFMLFISWMISRWQTGKIIKPINEINLEQPLVNELYPELKPLLTAIDEQNRQKDALANMRKEFSANVSHELKTPLTSISGYAEIMKNGIVRQEDIPDFSNRIYKEARRLIRLIDDIIKISKLDEGAIDLEKENVDLFSLCSEIHTRLSKQLNDKKINMTLEGESVNYFGIRPILDEMIYNLCENAIKYNEPGGRVNLWVGHTLFGPKVRVSDNGIGIPEKDYERIFERFYRVDKSHSKETGGTGLGLSIVKHGAMLHNAKVALESKVGEGTTFEIRFEDISL